MPETALPDREVELERLRLDAEVRKAEATSKVRQVIYGTMIVGLAAAAFPFAQKLAELSFTARIEQAKLVVDEERERRSFLNSLAEEGRSQEIERRIILAEFFSYMAVQDAERRQWREFLEFLHARQRQLNEERRVLLAQTVDARTTTLEYAAARSRLDQITRLEAPPPVAQLVRTPVDYFEHFAAALSDADRGSLRLNDPRVASALRALVNEGPEQAEFARRLLAEADMTGSRRVTVNLSESDPVFPILQSRLGLVGIEIVREMPALRR